MSGGPTLVLAALGVSTNHVGYARLVLFVGGESIGLLLPGETALILFVVVTVVGARRRRRGRDDSSPAQ